MEVGGKVHVVLHGGFQAAVEDLVLLAAIGDDFDFADHDVGAIRAARHARGERQLEFADALGFEGELRTADAAGLHGDGSCRARRPTSENQSSCCNCRLTSPRAPE